MISFWEEFDEDDEILKSNIYKNLGTNVETDSYGLFLNEKNLFSQEPAIDDEIVSDFVEKSEEIVVTTNDTILPAFLRILLVNYVKEHCDGIGSEDIYFKYDGENDSCLFEMRDVSFFVQICQNSFIFQDFDTRAKEFIQGFYQTVFQNNSFSLSTSSLGLFPDEVSFILDEFLEEIEDKYKVLVTKSHSATGDISDTYDIFDTYNIGSVRLYYDNIMDNFTTADNVLVSSNGFGIQNFWVELENFYYKYFDDPVYEEELYDELDEY